MTHAATYHAMTNRARRCARCMGEAWGQVQEVRGMGGERQVAYIDTGGDASHIVDVLVFASGELKAIEVACSQWARDDVFV